MNPQKRRQLILGIALSVTLALVFWVSRDQAEAVVQPAPRHPSGVYKSSQIKVASSASAVEKLHALSRRGSGVMADALAPANWLATPVPAQSASAAAMLPPQAPALPFQVLGKYIEDGKLAVFLQYGERNIVARAGDTIDDYRVDQIGGGLMAFTYLPLNEKQTLVIGEVN
ncbi:hypothetical protein [Andreprevotia chitinilytica]|uniref:hypothetical protein n=1 Tax=Andreprevotia chitinilytica TaxID=396808 RepID=UPI00068A1A75|nr:hypothetical protein [Andreprevotia chitinilytica]